MNGAPAPAPPFLVSYTPVCDANGTVRFVTTPESVAFANQLMNSFQCAVRCMAPVGQVPAFPSYVAGPASYYQPQPPAF